MSDNDVSGYFGDKKFVKNRGLSVRASEKKWESFWWHMALNPKLSGPPPVHSNSSVNQLLLSNIITSPANIYTHQPCLVLLTENSACVSTKGQKPIQDQSSVLSADILNIRQNYYYCRSFDYSQLIQLTPR